MKEIQSKGSFKQSRAELLNAYTDRISIYHVQAPLVVVVDGMARREQEQEEECPGCDVADDGTWQVRKRKGETQTTDSILGWFPIT